MGKDRDCELFYIYLFMPMLETYLWYNKYFIPFDLLKYFLTLQKHHTINE